MWDERYSEPGFAFGREPNDFLRAVAQMIPAGGKVLCLGEGEGRNAVFLAQQGYAVTAVDRSSVGLAKVQTLADEAGVGVKTAQADVVDFDIGGAQWDGIVAVYLHLSPEIRRALHARIVEGLRLQGVYILEAYAPKQVTMPGVGGPAGERAHWLMDLTSLRDELGGLSWVVAEERDREVNEGRYHHGLSSVVQLVARKLPSVPSVGKDSGS